MLGKRVHTGKRQGRHVVHVPCQPYILSSFHGQRNIAVHRVRRVGAARMRKTGALGQEGLRRAAADSWCNSWGTGEALYADSWCNSWGAGEALYGGILATGWAHALILYTHERPCQ